MRRLWKDGGAHWPEKKLLTGVLQRNKVEGLHVADSVNLEAHVLFWIHAAGELLRFGLGEAEGDAGPEQPFES